MGPDPIHVNHESSKIMMHRQLPHASRTLLRCALLGTAVTLGGCGLFSDKAFQAQLQAQAEIEDAGAEYSALLSECKTGDPVDVAGKVDRLIGRMQSIQGLSDGQKQSVDRMVTSMNALAGSLRASAVMQLMGDQAMLREQIEEQAVSALILGTAARSRTNAEFSESGALIEQKKATFQGEEADMRSIIAAIQPEMTKMTQQLERSTDQLNSLQADILRLRQKANDAGPVEGYPMVEEAAGVKTRAIPLKTSIAEVEAELGVLQPELERMEAELAGISAKWEATLGAEERTNRLKDAVRAAGASGFSHAGEMIAGIRENMDVYNQREQNEILPLLEQAISNLQKAQRARDAGNGANAARKLGDLHALRADAAMKHAALFGALAGTGELQLGDGDSWAKMAESARDEHTTSIEAARTAYQSVLEKLGQSNKNQVARASVEKLLGALDGESIISSGPVAIEAPRRATERRTPDGNRRRDRAGGGDLGSLMGTMGFATPEELAEFLNGLASRTPGPQLMMEVIGASYTTDPATIAQMSDPQAGAQSMGMLGGMLGGMTLEVESISDSRGMLAPLNPPANMPIKITFPIIKHEGKWYLDIDELERQMESMMNSAFENMDIGGGEGFAPSGGGGRGGGRPGRGRGN